MSNVYDTGVTNSVENEDVEPSFSRLPLETRKFKLKLLSLDDFPELSSKCSRGCDASFQGLAGSVHLGQRVLRTRWGETRGKFAECVEAKCFRRREI